MVQSQQQLISEFLAALGPSSVRHICVLSVGRLWEHGTRWPQQGIEGWQSRAKLQRTLSITALQPRIRPE
jgi:hypothetical protein